MWKKSFYYWLPEKRIFNKGVEDIMHLKPFPSMGWVKELHYFKGQGPLFLSLLHMAALYKLFTIIGHYRSFYRFWHKGAVQHNSRHYFGRPPPQKFWNPRLSQTHYPLFWGLFLLCFVALRSQPIWKFGWKKNWTSTQINSRTMHYLSTQKGA